MSELRNPFTKAVRRAAFDKALVEVMRAFPTASEHFVRKCAWSKARQVKIEPKPRKQRVQHSVAQTYRAPTRAERMGEHKAKMAAKKLRRAR